MNVGILEQNSTNVGRSRFTMVLCVRGVWREMLLVKCWESMMCVWSKMMFLIQPRQGTTPQILKAKFPAQTLGQKQKRK